MTEGRIQLTATMFFVSVPGSYPDRLQKSMEQRYTGQTLQVVNEGKAGEWAADGVLRFPGVLRTHNPQVVIILEGANDLNFLGRGGMSRTIGHLESMAKEARFRGSTVILAGLPPQRRGSVGGSSADFIAEFNGRVRDIARGEDALFVDLAAALGTDAGYIGPDGLHPSPEGYERIAQVFQQTIQSNFEEAPAAATGTR